MRSDFLSIQYLRGFAAVGVLLFHASQRAGAAFGAGAAGVDVFFIISGFIMWTISARRAAGPGDFLVRRAGRIAPLYWTVTLLIVGLDLLRPSLFPNMRLNAPHVVQSLLFLPHHDPTGAIAPVIVPGWTLNYEAFFYLAFALTLLLPAGRRAWALTIGLGGLCLIGLFLPRGRWAAVDTYCDPLVLEFVAGAWLAKAAAAGRLGREGAALAAIGAGLVILAVVAVTGADVRGWARLAEWGLPALLIVWGALSLEGAGCVSKIAPLKLLGDASYSIYLAHGLAISLAFKLLGGRGLPAAAEVAVAVPFGLAAGLGCYWLLERPLLKLFHNRRRPSPAGREAPAWPFLRAKASS
ncbi:MAG TPA: acyltransferase [Caulobacteraceae bacterium]|jgi:exopolysaccharide production protein ExoZ